MSAQSRARATRSAVIAADVDAIMATLADFAAYPEWLPAIREARVVSLDDDGRPARVAFVLVAGIVEDEYELRYRWDVAGNRLSWELVEPTPLQRFQQGTYELRPTDDPGRTEVTYSLDVELAVGMMGRFRERAERRIIGAALDDLARRVEAG